MNSRLWPDVRLFLLVLTLMAAPTNISFATATDIGTLTRGTPYTTTQRVDDAGTTYTVWYKYTAVTGDTELSVFGYGGTSYTATVTFWTDASTQYLSNSTTDRPSQIPVTPGTTYAFKFTPPGGNPSPATLTLTVELGPDDQLAAGQIAINDSTDGYPVVVMDPSSGEPISFHHPFAAGEGVRVLQSGIVCAVDAFNAPEGPRLYNPDLTLRATPTMPATNYVRGMGTNQIDTFWAVRCEGVANCTAVSIDRDGVASAPLDLGNTSYTSGVTPQADNTAVYGIRGTVINKITNPGGVVSALITVDATFAFACPPMMMTDDTLLVAYEKAATTAYVKRFSLSGTLLNTFTLTGVTGLVVEQLFADPADPDYFWVWYQSTTDNFFRRITVSSGAYTEVNWVKFVEGDYQDAVSATPRAMFGADFSCVPFIPRGTAETETFTIRRQRRFLAPTSPDHKFMQLPRLEVLMRTGIGLTPGPSGSPVQGEDPQVMFRFSKDGGLTWIPERDASAGAIGQYKDRVYWVRPTGNYRDGVIEITTSDPVDYQFLAAIADPKEGLS